MVPTLIRYLEMRKAIKAIEFANAVARKIRWPSHTDYCKFSRVQAGMVDVRFEDYAARELLLLCSEALPAFVTHALLDVVTDCVAKDITGVAIPVVRDLVGNLAEVFCLTDPSIHDNPIIYASEGQSLFHLVVAKIQYCPGLSPSFLRGRGISIAQMSHSSIDKKKLLHLPFYFAAIDSNSLTEFHRTTQYGTTYAIDRNCRFLQGPASDKNTLLRISRAISLGRECNELILN